MGYVGNLLKFFGDPMEFFEGLVTDLLSTAAVRYFLYTPGTKDLPPSVEGACVWLSLCLRSQVPDSSSAAL